MATITLPATNSIATTTTPINTGTNSSTASTIAKPTPTASSMDFPVGAGFAPASTTTTPIKTSTPAVPTTPTTSLAPTTTSTTATTPTTNTTATTPTTNTNPNGTTTDVSGLTTGADGASYNLQTGEGLNAEPANPANATTLTAPPGYTYKYDSNDKSVLAPLTASDNQTQLQATMASEANNFSTAISNIENGTTPLNAGEQAQVDGVNASYQQLISATQQATKAQQQMAELAGARGGGFASPEFTMANITPIIQNGATKIASLQQEQAGAVAKLTESLQANDISEIKTAYDALTASQEEQSKVLQDTISNTQTAINDAQAEADRQTQMAQTATQDAAVDKQNADALAEKTKNDAFTNNLDQEKENLAQETYNAQYGTVANGSLTTPQANGTSIIVAPAGYKGNTQVVNGVPVVSAADVPIVTAANQASALLAQAQALYQKINGATIFGIPTDPTDQSQYNAIIGQLNSSLSSLSSSDPSFSGLQGMSAENPNGLLNLGIFDSKSGNQNFQNIQNAINSGLSGKLPGYVPPTSGTLFTSPQTATQYYTSTGQTQAYNNILTYADNYAQQNGLDVNGQAPDSVVLQFLNYATPQQMSTPYSSSTQ